MTTHLYCESLTSSKTAHHFPVPLSEGIIYSEWPTACFCRTPQGRGPSIPQCLHTRDATASCCLQIYSYQCKSKVNSCWWVVFLSSCYTNTHFQTLLDLPQAVYKSLSPWWISSGTQVLLCSPCSGWCFLAACPVWGRNHWTSAVFCSKKSPLSSKKLNAQDIWTVTCRDPPTPVGWPKYLKTNNCSSDALERDLQGWSSKLLPVTSYWP